jgi:hypothetical protein
MQRYGVRQYQSARQFRERYILGVIKGVVGVE